MFDRKDLLGLEGLAEEELLFLLDTAASFKEISERDIKKVPALRGKTIVSLFCEPSTRTRASFEIAAKRLSADFVSLSSATASVAKGETLLDTARNLAAMKPDALVIRHPSAGAAAFLSRRVPCAVINAGDGSHEHPTQALLDLLTIRERKGKIRGLRVAIVGDILHSRVARSNLFALTTLGAEVCLVGPPTLVPPVFSRWAEVRHELRSGIRGADVVIVLRLQRERQTTHFFPTLEEYAHYFCLTPEALRSARPDAIVLHPGPLNRGVEISSEVADSQRAVILEQVANGIAVRMAVLYLLVGSRRGVASEPAAEWRAVNRTA
ncbi:MAG: aspartate carbamoyltransferase [Candidatus Binatia bacterium]|nr:MAG: aspartate carbamoyltransferase [Candidatus Binatia bacterium]